VLLRHGTLSPNNGRDDIDDDSELPFRPRDVFAGLQLIDDSLHPFTMLNGQPADMESF